MLYKSPTQDVIHVGLTDGTAIAIGPEPREIPPKFESHVLSAGAVMADNGKRIGRPPREQQATTDPSPESAITDDAVTELFVNDDAL